MNETATVPRVPLDNYAQRARAEQRANLDGRLFLLGELRGVLDTSDDDGAKLSSVREFLHTHELRARLEQANLEQGPWQGLAHAIQLIAYAAGALAAIERATSMVESDDTSAGLRRVRLYLLDFAGLRIVEDSFTRENAPTHAELQHAAHALEHWSWTGGAQSSDDRGGMRLVADFLRSGSSEFLRPLRREPAP